MNPTTKNKYHHQKGITLLLSVIIMLIILIITLTVSFLATQEIRASKSVFLSELAITGAQSAGEEGLWALKRQGDFESCDSNPAYTPLSESDNKVQIRRCKKFDSVLVTLEANKPLAILLYDPADPNGNVCMNESYTPGSYSGCAGNALINKINVIQNSGSSAITVTVQDFDLINPWSATATAQTTGAVITPADISVPDPISGSSDERLTLILDPGVNEATVTVTVTPNGLPNFPTIDAEACAAGKDIAACSDSNDILKRRVNITVPQQ
jgi:hypothetical protein